MTSWIQTDSSRESNSSDQISLSLDTKPIIIEAAWSRVIADALLTIFTTLEASQNHIDPHLSNHVDHKFSWKKSPKILTYQMQKSISSAQRCLKIKLYRTSKSCSTYIEKKQIEISLILSQRGSESVNMLVLCSTLSQNKFHFYVSSKLSSTSTLLSIFLSVQKWMLCTSKRNGGGGGWALLCVVPGGISSGNVLEQLLRWHFQWQFVKRFLKGALYDRITLRPSIRLSSCYSS